MTILGCDDSVSQCHYVSTVSGTWQTIAVCDAESQKQLPKFSNANYPVIVAVCEPSGDKMANAKDPAPRADGTSPRSIRRMPLHRTQCRHRPPPNKSSRACPAGHWRW
ncbi:hypothetical protein LP421_09790 [Rhizobium sp. RCAM05350]|nr:hypothetical protein LP421_09790 [Rhizobium sp. RCAM05350]